MFQKFESTRNEASKAEKPFGMGSNNPRSVCRDALDGGFRLFGPASRASPRQEARNTTLSTADPIIWTPRNLETHFHKHA
jgi:hypothetical protein